MDKPLRKALLRAAGRVCQLRNEGRPVEAGFHHYQQALILCGHDPETIAVAREAFFTGAIYLMSELFGAPSHNEASHSLAAIDGELHAFAEHLSGECLQDRGVVQ
jgi:hypothetical protein